MVWRTARQLHDALAGRVLTRSDFRVPRYATSDLTGRAVIAAAARGKHLLVRVDGPADILFVVPYCGLLVLRRQRQVIALVAGMLVGLLYGAISTSGAFRDITSGNNGAYSAGPGWDACSGWGVADGNRLLQALSG